MHADYQLFLTIKSLNTSAVLQVGSFLPFGLGAVACNAIIILAVKSNSLLRQRREYQVITALAFADFVEGFATMISAIYRLGVLFFGHRHSTLTPLQCMLLPQSWLWRWSDAATATMLLAVSIDRLISVVAPIRYFRLGASYASILIGISYSYSFVSSLFAWIHPLSEWSPISALCMTRDFTSLPFYQYSKYTTSAASLLSVLIYVPLLFAMREQLHFISTRISFTQVFFLCVFSLQIDRKKKAQLRVTATLGLSSVSTLLFDAIPRAIGAYLLLKEEETSASHSLYFFHLTKINSMINLLLLYSRHRNMRFAIKQLFHGSRPKHKKFALTTT